MAGKQVRALYAFDGEPGTAELSIEPGEILYVTREDVGEGWWEGQNHKGDIGLFPAAYVEEVKASQPPSEPPPPLPEGFGDAPQVPAVSDWGVDNNAWGPQTGDTAANQSFEGNDYWDDEWDDDSEGGGTQSGGPPNAPSSHIHKMGSAGDISSMGKMDNRGTVGRKNFNRFTTFVKSGGESYILGTVKVSVPDTERVFIYETEDGVMWNPIKERYNCQVASPKKESKLKGLKSFIAYQLTPSFNNIQVSRRYKHFDWLHERLEEKFSLIPIPPLPDKQISGRYEEQFIEHRRVQLQNFVNCICRHPVLSQCEVWQHFITCTDEKRWKTGKRKAEKDELVGANYFMALQAPERNLDIPWLEQEMESFGKFIHGMDVAVRNLMNTATDQTKKHQGPYKREYQRVGQAFLMLANAFDMDTESPRASLTAAVRRTGDTYHDIGKLYEEQPKLDWEPLADTLHIYKGMISSFPDILTVHRGALQKRKECEKLASDHKMDQTQLKEVIRRTDVVSYALLAEVSHFHSERVIDFKCAMQKYLTEQIKFYQEVIGKLQTALSMYED